MCPCDALHGGYPQMYTCFKNTKTYPHEPREVRSCGSGTEMFPTEDIERRPTRRVMGIEAWSESG
jgi:hypothetical protein